MLLSSLLQRVVLLVCLLKCSVQGNIIQRNNLGLFDEFPNEICRQNKGYVAGLRQQRCLAVAEKGGKHSQIGRDKVASVPVALGKDSKPAGQENNYAHEEGKIRRIH
jgi:hypothetical protein